MLTFDTESYAASGETAVFVTASNGDRALITAHASQEAATEFAAFMNWMSAGYARHAVDAVPPALVGT